MCLWLNVVFGAHRTVFLLPNSLNLCFMYMSNIFFPCEIILALGVSLGFQSGAYYQLTNVEPPYSWKYRLTSVFCFLILWSQVCALGFYICTHKDTLTFWIAESTAIMDITYALFVDFIGFICIMLYVNIFE